MYLLGGALSLTNDVSRKYWREQFNGVVCGKVHNAYSTKDRILQIYKVATGEDSPIGLGVLSFETEETPEDPDRLSFTVENTDVTAIADGHLQYRENMKAVLEALDFAKLF